MTDETQVWHDPNFANTLDPLCHEVHVWQARLSQSALDLSAFPGDLSQEEHQRASRFRSDHDRMRFLLGRLIARSVLGRCLKQQAREVRFTLDHSGKPAVASSSIHFNISHSGDHVLFALAQNHRIGVDVEQLRKIDDLDDIAATHFSVAERSRLKAVPQPVKTECFFRCWTMKEAYIKGRGEGFGLPLDSFDVAFLPDETPRLLATRFDPADAARWCFRQLNVGPGYLAALVTDVAPPFTLRLWDWNRWRRT